MNMRDKKYEGSRRDIQPSPNDMLRWYLDTDSIYRFIPDPKARAKFSQKGWVSPSYVESLMFGNPADKNQDIPEKNKLEYLVGRLNEAKKNRIENKPQPFFQPNPYDKDRANILETIKNTPISELLKLTREGTLPHKELLTDYWWNVNPSGQMSGGWDTPQRYLPVKKPPLKHLPPSLALPPKDETGHREGFRRMTSLEAANELNQRVSQRQEDNADVLHNYVNQFIPNVRDWRGLAGFRQGDKWISPKPDAYIRNNTPIHTFDPDDENSAVIVNEAFPENWQLLHRSDDTLDECSCGCGVEASLIKATADEAAYKEFRERLTMSPFNRFDFNAALEQFGEGGFYLDENTNNFFDKEGQQYGFDEDEGEYQLPLGPIPTPLGQGLEARVFNIPTHDMVAKVPKDSDRGQRSALQNTITRHPFNLIGGNNNFMNSHLMSAPDNVMRSPLEAWWSKVLGDFTDGDISPYSVFNTKYGDTSSLDLVQEKSPTFQEALEWGIADEARLGGIAAHLFGLKDINVDEDDMVEYLDGLRDEDIDWEIIDAAGGDMDEARQMAANEYGNPQPFYEEGGNVGADGRIIDYVSESPFIDDERGLYGQEEIARLLASAKRTPIPKRYPQYTPDISRDVRQIISELDDSRKKKRLLGSSIDFPNSRFEVEGF